MTLVIRLFHADIYLMFKTLKSFSDTFERIQNIHAQTTNIIYTRYPT